ncbi:hypothetical protein V6N12_014218 [Hibiscus sabdariffa]|uniref:Uncharacterized protein n=1 Tax=Hibiscus sabdariffa TaxID=183260 RepID=A0ABR2DJI7_9ROSI
MTLYFYAKMAYALWQEYSSDLFPWNRTYRIVGLRLLAIFRRQLNVSACMEEIPEPETASLFDWFWYPASIYSEAAASFAQ